MRVFIISTAHRTRRFRVLGTCLIIGSAAASPAAGLLPAGTPELRAQAAARTGATVAGTFYRSSRVGQEPAAGVAITLVDHSTRQRHATILTDSHGRYFFYAVPGGTYYLEIHVANGRPLKTVLISIPAAGELVLPPMQLP